jgi:hypothetical protein
VNEFDAVDNINDDACLVSRSAYSAASTREHHGSPRLPFLFIYAPLLCPVASTYYLAQAVTLQLIEDGDFDVCNSELGKHHTI